MPKSINVPVDAMDNFMQKMDEEIFDNTKNTSHTFLVEFDNSTSETIGKKNLTHVFLYYQAKHIMDSIVKITKLN